MMDIQTDKLCFKPSLPFQPCKDQVLYVEDVYNPEINGFLRDNHDDLCAGFARVGYEFCYLPCISRRLSDREVVRYFTPYRRNEPINRSLDSTCLLPFVKRTYELKPALLVFDNGNARGYTFRALRLDGHVHGLRPLFDAFLGYLGASRGSGVSVRFCNTSDIIGESDDYADQCFSEDVLELMADVSEKIKCLRQYGVNEMVLRSLLEPQIRLSRLHVTPKGQILLPGYGGLEIRMSPLVKAVYFLFLRHEEGLLFKSLPDYRDELYRIYIRLTGRGSDEAVRRSIIDVTDPCKNSINEKCARIREAFVREFDDRLAGFYYVTGSRGCAKCIRLPRNLVDWEMGDF